MCAQPGRSAVVDRDSPGRPSAGKRQLQCDIGSPGIRKPVHNLLTVRQGGKAGDTCPRCGCLCLGTNDDLTATRCGNGSVHVSVDLLYPLVDSNVAGQIQRLAEVCRNMGSGNGPGLDVAALNGSGGNLIAGNGGGQNLIGGDGRRSNLVSRNGTGYQHRTVDLLLILLIRQFLSRKSRGFCIDFIDQAIRTTDNEALCGQCAGGDDISVQRDYFRIRNGSIRDLCSSHSTLSDQGGGNSTEGNLRRIHSGIGNQGIGDGRLRDLRCSNSQVSDLRPRNGQVGDFRCDDLAIQYLCRNNGGILNVCSSDSRASDLRVGDRCIMDLCGFDLAITDLGVGDRTIFDFGSGDCRIMDVGGQDFTIADFRGGNGTILDLSRSYGGISDFGLRNGGILNLSRADSCIADLCFRHSSIFDLGCANGSVSYFCFGYCRILNMSGFNRRHLDLNRTNGAFTELTSANRVDCQLAAGDDPTGKLPGRDRISLHGIRNGTEGHAGIFPGQAVIGVLRHAHGHPNPDPGSDHPNSITEEDILQEAVFLILLGLGTVDEADVQRDGRNIAPGIKLGLRGIPHEGIALRFGLRVIAIRVFLRFGNGQVNPFRVGVGVDQGTVDIQFRKIQHVAVRILAGRHDSGNDVRKIDIIGNAQQVLGLPDLYIGILTDPFHDENVPPVPGQFARIFLHDSIFPKQGIHGIDILELHVFSGTIQIRIEGEIMGRQAVCGNAIYNSSPHRRG